MEKARLGATTCELRINVCEIILFLPMNKIDNKIESKLIENKIENICGVILSGGKSKRMGTDKAMLKVDGTPAIERIFNTLSGIFRDIIIISDYPQNYKYLTSNIYPDIYRSAGPIGGIHSALSNAENSHIFVVSCDIPLINENSIRYIINKKIFSQKISQKNDIDITLPIAFGRLQPLCGIYPKNCLPVFDGILSGAGELGGSKNKKLGLIKALESLKALENFEINTIDFDASDMDCNCFLNMNDPDDYETICGMVEF